MSFIVISINSNNNFFSFFNCGEISAMDEVKAIKGIDYDVSILMVTDKSISSAKDLTTKLVLEKNLFKRQKKVLAGEKNLVENYWILQSKVNDNDPLISHLDDLISQLSCIKNTIENPSIKETYLDIGVFYDGDIFAYGKVLFPIKKITFLNSIFKNLKLEITCYPYIEES